MLVGVGRLDDETLPEDAAKLGSDDDSL